MVRIVYLYRGMDYQPLLYYIGHTNFFEISFLGTEAIYEREGGKYLSPP